MCVAAICVWRWLWSQVDELRKSLVDLQEVVAYFRREKELADANKQVGGPTGLLSGSHEAVAIEPERLSCQSRRRGVRGSGLSLLWCLPVRATGGGDGGGEAPHQRAAAAEAPRPGRTSLPPSPLPTYLRPSSWQEQLVVTTTPDRH